MTTRKLSAKSLFAMLGRWKRDLERLEQAHGQFTEQVEGDTPKIEVQRNLATAIAQMEMLIRGELP